MEKRIFSQSHEFVKNMFLLDNGFMPCILPNAHIDFFQKLSIQHRSPHSTHARQWDHLNSNSNGLSVHQSIKMTHAKVNQKKNYMNEQTGWFR